LASQEGEVFDVRETQDDCGCDVTSARTILLIDDCASVREVLRVALESEGYLVLEASDGRYWACLNHEQSKNVPVHRDSP